MADHTLRGLFIVDLERNGLIPITWNPPWTEGRGWLLWVALGLIATVVAVWRCTVLAKGATRETSGFIVAILLAIGGLFAWGGIFAGKEQGTAAAILGVIALISLVLPPLPRLRRLRRT